TGAPPTPGFAEHGGARAVVSTASFSDLADGSDELRNRLAKQAIHAVGHLWELHSCLDARCAMHPPWSEGVAANTEQQLGDSWRLAGCRPGLPAVYDLGRELCAIV